MRPPLADVLEAAASWEQAPLDALLRQSEPLAQLLAESTLRTVEAGVDRELEQALESLWTAANLRAEAARLLGSSAALRGSVSTLQRDLAVVDERVRAEFERGAAGGDAGRASLSAYHVHRADAVGARLDDDRAGRIAALNRALAAATSLVAVRRSQFEAGQVGIEALVEPERLRYEAAAALAGLTSSDPGQVRQAKTAELDRLVAALGRIVQLSAAGGRAPGIAPSPHAVLAQHMEASYGARLAALRGERNEQAERLGESVKQAEKLLALVTNDGSRRQFPAAVVLDASMHLQRARLALARRAVSDAAAYALVRREAFQEHAAVAENVLNRSAARYRAGLESVSRCAYAAARSLWIRLQVARLGRAQVATEDAAYASPAPARDGPERVPAPRPEPVRRAAAGAPRARGSSPCRCPPVIVVPCP